MNGRSTRLRAVLAHVLVLASTAVLVSGASAEGGITIGGTEVPWGVISTLISATAAVLTLLLRSSLQTMRVEFNHQMTEALKATLEKGRAEGILEEKARQASELAARAEGVAEGKGLTP